MRNISVPEVNVLRNSSTLAPSVPINISIKLGFVSVNGPRETYFGYTLQKQTIYYYCNSNELPKTIVAINIT